MLEFEDVTFGYRNGGGRPLLTHANYAIQANERICVTGNSGTGKTTFLTLAGGLQEPNLGKVRFRGRAWSSFSQSERTRLRAELIGFIFQSPNLIPVMTAYENVEFALSFACPSLSPRARRRKARESLELSGVLHLEKLRPAQMSGGECQRVAVARAIAKTPVLILADEPTSQLDDLNANRIQGIFDALNRDLNVTLITATHDARISLCYARRIDLNRETGPLSLDLQPKFSHP